MRPTLPSRLLVALASRKLLHCLIVATISLALSATAVAQGFGFFKPEGRLNRTHPPRAYVPIAAVVARVESQRSEAQNILQRLRYDLEQALSAPTRPALSAASTLRTLLVACTIDDLSTASRRTTRSRSVYKKTGEHTETDPITKQTKTVEDRGWVWEDYWVTINEGDIRATIEVKDPDTGLTLDAGQVSASHREESEFLALASDETIRTYLADALVRQVVARYAPVADGVHVLLPRGKLKDAGEQLAEGRWNMALELLRAVPAFSDPRDEAYRLYSFGLAYEGLAYQPQDAGLTVALLRRALEAYDAAARGKADEGVFIEARLRATAGIAEYTAFLGRISAFEAARIQALQALGKAVPGDAGKAAATGAATTPAPPLAPANAPPSPRVAVYKGVGKLTNKVVVRWVKVGISEGDIVTNIMQSRSNDFDVSPKGLVKLKQAGVSDQVLLAMQSYQTPRRLSRRGVWALGSALLLWQYLPLLLIL